MADSNLPSSLSDAESHYRRLTSTVPAMLYDYVLYPDGSNQFLYVGSRCWDLLELKESELLADSGSFWCLLHPDDLQRLKNEDVAANKGGESFSADVRIITRSGKMKWINLSSKPNPAPDGEPVVWSGFMLDISERKQAEEELRIAAIAFASQNGMMITNPTGIILRVNPAFTRLTGYSAKEAIGQRPSMLKSGRRNQFFYQRMWATIQENGFWQGEVWNKRKDGMIYAEMLSITAVITPGIGVSHYVGSFTDITTSKEAEAEIHRLAYYDPLTRLPNRRLLQDRMEQAVIASSRNRLYGAVFLLDLDKFKEINDTQGHDIGDMLLVEVAKRLLMLVREGDTVARLGGDEFVLLLDGLGETAMEAATKAETVGEKILVTLNHTYQLGSFMYHSTPSIGITLFGEQQENFEEILKRADLAMYHSKTSGRNTLHFFDPQMQLAIKARSNLEKDLRPAINGNQFFIFYQAQVTEDGYVSGAEALVRWQHPERGMVSPADFIPFAEETGLILPIGHWVLEAACTQLAIWATVPYMEHLTVSVNVSAHQFQQECFVAQVLEVVERRRVNPQRLKLELTESMLVTDIENIISKMNTLKERGVSFSLDDFGTGFSSLSYLSRLPLDQIKIDRSFVKEIEFSDNAVVICASTIGLAHNLKLKVVAEGVETEAQHYLLSTVHHCDLTQGYLFSRPLPLLEFEKTVKLGRICPSKAKI